MLDTVLRGARIAGAGAGADAPLVDIGIAGGTIRRRQVDSLRHSLLSSPLAFATTRLMT